MFFMDAFEIDMKLQLMEISWTDAQCFHGKMAVACNSFGGSFNFM